MGVQSFYGGRLHEGVARRTGPAGGLVLPSHEQVVRKFGKGLYPAGVEARLVLLRSCERDESSEQEANGGCV